MMNSNRNRGRFGDHLCPGGRNCCGDPIGRKREARRTTRRREKAAWKREAR